MIERLFLLVPVELHTMAIVVLVTLCVTMGFGVYCYKTCRMRCLFVLLCVLAPSLLLWSIPFAIPYLNGQFSLSGLEQELDHFRIGSGQLAVWKESPDYLRYYLPVNFVELKIPENARAFFAVDKPVYCLVKTGDLESLKQIVPQPIYELVYYAGKSQKYTLISQFPKESLNSRAIPP